MNSNDFISVEQSLSDVLERCDDAGLNYGLDYGYYQYRIQQAVQFFALHTLYEEITKDIFNWDTSGNQTRMMPTNCFNIKEVYLFNGDYKCPNDELSHTQTCTCGGSLSGADMVFCHWKRTLSIAESNRKSMKIFPNGNDRINGKAQLVDNYDIGCAVYFNIQNGRLIFSDGAKAYSHLRIKYNGMGSDNGDLPCVPRIIQEGVEDKATMDILEVLKVREPNKYRTHYMDARAKFYGAGGNDRGSFMRTKVLVSRLDTVQIEALRNYLSNPDIK